MTQLNQQALDLTGKQFMYGKPEVLNKDLHADLRYQSAAAPFAKAQALHLVPLLVGEFAQAMQHYPIIFAGEKKTPLAVMGLAGKNFFIQDGNIEADAYVPAYLRRHPFTLASAGSDQFVVCIDRDEAGFVTEGEGQALFENGEPTALTRHAMDFLGEFQVETVRTDNFVKMLDEAGLLEVKNTVFVVDGHSEPVAEYIAVSEERIAALSDEQLVELVRSGAMAVVNAHLLSLQQWTALLARRTLAASADTQVANVAPVTQESAATQVD
jgi:hypothetical protein